MMRCRRLLLLLPAMLAVGCATRFQQPAAVAPHAVVSFPAALEVSATSVFLEPWTVNSLRRSRYLQFEPLRVPPGDLQLLVMATTENTQGSCLLNFAVVAGESVQLRSTASDDGFEIRVFRDGHDVAACEAPRSPRPTPLWLPGEIPPRYPPH